MITIAVFFNHVVNFNRSCTFPSFFVYVCIEVLLHFIFLGGNDIPLQLIAFRDDQWPDFYVFGIKLNRTCLSNVRS